MRRNLLVAFFTAPWWLFALMRIFSLDREWPLIPAVAFTPQVTVVVILPLLLALLLRAKWMALGIGVLALILLAMISPRAVGGSQPEPGGKQVKIFSANLLHGDAEPKSLLAAIRRADPDIIALQEATPENLEMLREAGVLRELPYVAGDPEWGTQGYFTVSRWKLRSTGDGLWPAYSVVGQGFEFRNLHPAPPIRPGGPTREWKAALASISPAGKGTLRIAVGDLNATLDHRDLRSVISRGYTDSGAVTGNGFEWTWRGVGSWWQMVIDHILIDKRASVKDYRVTDLPGSDHNAISATVTLPR